MIAGIDYWDEDVKRGLSSQKIEGKELHIYEDTWSLYGMLRNTAYKFPDKKAVIDSWGKTYTYSQFLNMTNVFAAYLKNNKKVGRGTHIGIMMYNSMEFCVSFLALSKLGAVCVPLPSKFTKSEVIPLGELANVEGVVCDNCFTEWFESHFREKIFVLSSDSGPDSYGLSPYVSSEAANSLEEGEREDVALLMFTSGTTGISKGVPLKNYNITHAIVSYQRIFHITEDDKTIIPVPIYHITGLVALLGLFIYCGGTLFLHRRFRAEQVLECMNKEGVTFFHSSPAILLLMLKEREKYPTIHTLRMIACGSSHMPIQKLKEFHRWLPDMEFRTIYGLTETTSPGTIFPCDAANHEFPDSSGRPIPGLEVAIWNEQGEEMPAETDGEIMIRGTVVPKTYWPERKELIDKSGWLHTGDVGHINEQGFLFVTDRKKDLINYGGEKVSCYEIENAIYEIEQVQECAVVAIKNEIYGEVAGAIICLKTGVVLSEKEVYEFLKSRLAKYKIPRKILFVDNIPKTPNNKIDKKHIKNVIMK